MRNSICLNGEWQFMPIYDNKIDWLKNIKWEDAKLLVPSSWKSDIDFNKTEEDKYSNIFDVFNYPMEWNNADAGVIGRSFTVNFKESESAWLVFNGIFQQYKIYINNQLAHEGSEAFLPLEIDLSQFLKAGQQIVDLKVWCSSLKRIDTPSGKKVVSPDGTWFAKMSRGIWQDVFLEYRRKSYIKDWQILTYYRNGSIRINIEAISQETQDFHVKAEIWDNNEIVKKLSGIPVTQYEQNEVNYECSLESNWSEAICWTPDKPYLYDLKIILSNGIEILDEITTRFGFREVWVEDYKLYLNGVRINIRGDSWHYQGFAQQNETFIRNWYKLCKETGVNTVRLHGMPYPTMYLDIADEMGMMIFDESGIYGSSKSMQADHPEYIENCYKHLEAFVRRDRNHPCVIMWSMQNEMRWVEGRDGFKTKMRGLMDLMEKLDGTRLVSADGDNRLMNKEDMQVVSMHYNIDGRVTDWDKSIPLCFGEHGKFHYISPQVSTEYAGQQAYLKVEEALKSLGREQRIFLEYARKEDVTGVFPFNLVNYMMTALPKTERDLTWKDLDTPGPKPRRTRAYALTLDNGQMGQQDNYFIPNEAYAECLDGYRSVVIIPNEYNNCFYDDAQVTRTFSVYNDTFQVKNSIIVYTLCQDDGLVWDEGEFQFDHAPGEREEVTIKINPRCVTEKVSVNLTMKLYHGEVLQFTFRKIYEIYPSCLKSKPIYTGDKRIAISGEDNIKIKELLPQAQILTELTKDTLADIDVLIIAPGFRISPKKVQSVLDGFCNNGGVLIVLEQENFSVGDTNLSGKGFFKTFINNLSHPLFENLTNEHFEFWHEQNPNDPNCGHLVTNAFVKPSIGKLNILLECGTGDFGWGGLLWTPLVEYIQENGLIILNQLELIRNLDKVPQAAIMLRNLIEYSIQFVPKESKSTQVDASDKTLEYLNKVGVEFSVNSDIYNGCNHQRYNYIKPCNTEYKKSNNIMLVEAGSLSEDNVNSYIDEVEAGGTLLVLTAQPEQESILSRLIGKNVEITLQPVYQLQKTHDVLLADINNYDLYRIENVTYSPSTKKNTVIATYAVKVEGAEALFSSVENPWHTMFINGRDPEPIKISEITKYKNTTHDQYDYGLRIKRGRGTIIISQLILNDDEKGLRVVSGLLSALGCKLTHRILNYTKQDVDITVPSMMAIEYEQRHDFDEVKKYYVDANYVLNNLGEGVYGWMTRIERQDGAITIQASSDKTYFLTAFIHSELNRNPLKRKGGELPDSSIVPDVIITTNCGFELWVNGICYMISENNVSKLKIDDVLLEKGHNQIALICYGKNEDIKFSLSFVTKYGDALDNIRYYMTMD